MGGDFVSLRWQFTSVRNFAGGTNRITITFFYFLNTHYAYAVPVRDTMMSQPSQVQSTLALRLSCSNGRQKSRALCPV